MPNWCSNVLVLSHKDPAKVKAAAEGFNEGNLLATLFPEPDYKTTAVAKAFPEIGAGYAKTDEERDKILANEPEIREDAWWDWRVTNWGTKWDVGGDGYVADISPDGTTVTMSFDSAWSPPIGAYEKIEAEGWAVDAYYYEPGMGFAGVWSNGFDDYYDMSGMDSVEVADTIPDTLNDTFGISENMAEWEAENAEDEEELTEWYKDGVDAKGLAPHNGNAE